MEKPGKVSHSRGHGVSQFDRRLAGQIEPAGQSEPAEVTADPKQEDDELRRQALLALRLMKTTCDVKLDGSFSLRAPTRPTMC